ncbi:hypothetical protein CHELA20_54333 [Hyphomicrobiales bacterium]|nr:hypothetical protein CHELA20_54333 [Hyphomicrobiales bacterium]
MPPRSARFPRARTAVIGTLPPPSPARHLRGFRGAPFPGRWVCKGRAEVSLLLEAGADTPVVVQGATALAASASAKGYGRQGLQGGAASPFARWVQGERSLPWSGCNAETLPSAARARCPHAADRIPCRIGRHKDGLIGSRDALRGSAGNRRVPPAR